MTDRRFINHQALDHQGQPLELLCRFCHIRQKYDKYEHVAPCGCAGPNRYVHRECIQRWMRVKFQHVYNHPHNGQPQDFNVFCQVCQQRMEMEFRVVNQLSNYEDFVEKISRRKTLFSTLLLLVTGLIVAVIVMTIFAAGGEAPLPPKYIFGFAVCSVLLVILGVIFLCNFVVIKSIDIIKVANHKEPIILGKEANLDSISEQGTQEEEADPHFGVQATKQRQEIDPSLMLQSKRDHEEAASSVVSKTLTDYVMMKMYRHDQASLKGRSQKQSKEERHNFPSRFKKQQVKETRDQSVQISNLQHQKRNAENNYNQVQLQDKSIQKSVNHIDQSIQKSHNLNNQSVQPSIDQRDASIQPSRLRSRRIFKEDPSVLPQSSLQNQPIQAVATVPKTRDRIYISEEERQPQFQQPPQRQRQQERSREYQLPAQIISSGDSKKSQEEFLQQAKPQAQDRVKLRTDRSPIRIRVKL